ncbi:unnamed protein product [Schistosoma margrebowiei]|uniref:Uncharacterized protein n=1 Tax=Schistosoma margrebowiei TaxID=48269 RepID=A0A183M6N7_9TREM|nr:unnamed protein product [Schistosoma margrebowiei]
MQRNNFLIFEKLLSLLSIQTGFEYLQLNKEIDQLKSCVIIFGVRIKHWSKTIELAETISRYMRGCNLLFNILFYRSPQAPRVAQPVRLLPISINLSNFSTSTEAAVHLAEKMWISIEQKYGCLPVRLQWASKDVYGR